MRCRSFRLKMFLSHTCTHRERSRGAQKHRGRDTNKHTSLARYTARAHARTQAHPTGIELSFILLCFCLVFFREAHHHPSIRIHALADTRLPIHTQNTESNRYGERFLTCTIVRSVNDLCKTSCTTNTRIHAHAQQPTRTHMHARIHSGANVCIEMCTRHRHRTA